MLTLLLTYTLKNALHFFNHGWCVVTFLKLEGVWLNFFYKRELQPSMFASDLDKRVLAMFLLPTHTSDEATHKCIF